jgi:hypothetical protein
MFGFAVTEHTNWIIENYFWLTTLHSGECDHGHPTGFKRGDLLNKGGLLSSNNQDP